LESRAPPDEDLALNELKRLKGGRAAGRGQTKRDEASSATTAADGATSLAIPSRLQSKMGAARAGEAQAVGTESKMTLLLQSDRQDSASNAS